MTGSVRAWPLAEEAGSNPGPAGAPVPRTGPAGAAAFMRLVQRQMSRLGQPHRWPWVVALCGLGVAALLGLAYAPAWRAEAAAAQEQGIARPLAREARAGRPAAGPGTAARPEAPRPVAVALPGAEESSARAARLVQLARTQGVTVTRLRETALQQSALQLELSAKAPYPAMRRFVALALQQDAALELRLLRAQRAGVDTPDLEIELQWALWHRPAVALAQALPAAGRGSP